VIGLSSIGLVLGLAVASELNRRTLVVALPIGVTATVLFAGLAPVVAIGGGSVRQPFEGRVSGCVICRVFGWISYGVAMAEATALIAIGAARIEAPAGLIVSTGVVGCNALALFAIDALVSRDQAKRQTASQSFGQDRVRVLPTFGAARSRDDKLLPTVGLAGAF
jgi:hypothetical protein